jgi:UDP-2-acetamido-3-amino-2,3-dideoxy-glucuronate N-acetyltransferase
VPGAAARIMPGADVDPTAEVGAGTTVWPLAQVREGARVGRECIIGRGAYLDTGVTLGDSCKVQNYALVYAPAQLDSGVFVGPGVVLTNDSHPRAMTADGRLLTGDDWHAKGVRVGHGASLGAGSVVLGGVRVGRWALVGAGAVVTSDVADHALVTGVPARQVGWVGYEGRSLAPDGERGWRSPESGDRFVEGDGGLEAVQ